MAQNSSSETLVSLFPSTTNFVYFIPCQNFSGTIGLNSHLSNRNAKFSGAEGSAVMPANLQKSNKKQKAKMIANYLFRAIDNHSLNSQCIKLS